MEIPTFKAETRTPAGSRAVARLRKVGRLPAIIYGHKIDPQSVSLDYHDVSLHVEHGVHLVTLQLDGQDQPCLIKDAQYDHLGARLVHLDLARVDLNERVKVAVPVEMRGTPKGVAEGGHLFQELTDVEIECLVTRIPESIRVDVSNIGLTEHLRVKDVPWGEGVTVLQDPETIVASVRRPVLEVEAAAPVAAEGEAAPEPEVIAKGKEEKEEGEGSEGEVKSKKEKVKGEK